MDSSKPPFDPSNFNSGESVAGEPSSATGVFGTVKQSSAPAPEDDFLQSLLREEADFQKTRTDSTATNIPVPPVTEVPKANAGSFTAMFQALKPGEAESAQAEQKNVSSIPDAVPSQKSAADLTGIFTPVSLNKAAAPTASPLTPIPAEAVKPGEFTQLLRTLTTPVVKDAEAGNAPAPDAQGPYTQWFNEIRKDGSGAPAPVSGPAPEQTTPVMKAVVPEAQPASGSFTQAFQTLPSNTSEPGPVQPESSVAQGQPAQPAAAGGFTQMFQALSPRTEAAAPPVHSQDSNPVTPQQQQAPAKAGPGSFTQMFQQLGTQPDPLQADPLASLKQEPVPESSFRFSALNPPESAPSRPDPATSGKGGFTQLFQTLGNEGAPAAKEPPPLMPSAPAANPAPPQMGGGFTQLLRTLNADQTSQQPAAPPMIAPQAPPTPMPQSGPGEFTRIISGSMLREAQAQSAPVIPPAPQGQQPQGSGFPGFQMPPAPAIPKMPAAPAFPQIPQMHAGGGAAPQMPHLPQAGQFGFPPAPAPPVPPAPPPSKLQQYLPLFLVVNVFVLIVIVLVVVFALRHH